MLAIAAVIAHLWMAMAIGGADGGGGRKPRRGRGFMGDGGDGGRAQSVCVTREGGGGEEEVRDAAGGDGVGRRVGWRRYHNACASCALVCSTAHVPPNRSSSTRSASLSQSRARPMAWRAPGEARAVMGRRWARTKSSDKKWRSSLSNSTSSIHTSFSCPTTPTGSPLQCARWWGQRADCGRGHEMRR